MGFNKLHIPSIDVLHDELQRDGEDLFSKKWVRRYIKADAIFGPEESLNFIKQFLINVYDN